MKGATFDLRRRLTTTSLVLSLLSLGLVGSQGTFQSEIGFSYVFHGHCHLYDRSVIQDFYGVELKHESDGGGWSAIEFGIDSEGHPFLEVNNRQVTNMTVLGLLFEGIVNTWNDYWIPLIKPPETDFQLFLESYAEKWQTLEEVESVQRLFYGGTHRIAVSGHGPHVPHWGANFNWESATNGELGYLSHFSWQNKTGQLGRILFSVSVSEGPWDISSREPLQELLSSIRALAILATVTFVSCLIAVAILAGSSFAVRRIK